MRVVRRRTIKKKCWGCRFVRVVRRRSWSRYRRQKAHIGKLMKFLSMPSTPNICFIAPPWLSGFGDTCFFALVRGHSLFCFPPPWILGLGAGRYDRDRIDTSFSYSLSLSPSLSLSLSLSPLLGYCGSDLDMCGLLVLS